MLALVTLVWLLQRLWLPITPGEQVRIRAPGLERIVPFQHDTELRVDGNLGPSRLRIADGGIRFVASPCPTQACVHGGAISRQGESLFCLPNGVSVQVLKGDPGYDSLGY